MNETLNDMSDWRGRVGAIDGEAGRRTREQPRAWFTNWLRSVGNVWLDEAPADLRVQPLDLDFEIVQAGDGFFDR